jgi:hypothetical protein
VTFFLTGPQRARLYEQLNAITRDRSAALITLLDLDRDHEPPSPN